MIIDRNLSTEVSASLVNSEAVNEIVANPDRANSLAIHLPVIEGMDSDKKKQVLDTIASPQFQQALTDFLNAVQSSNLGPVVAQFELPADAVTAASAGNLDDFIKALNKAKTDIEAPVSDSQKSESEDKTDKSPNEDDKKSSSQEKPPSAE